MGYLRAKCRRFAAVALRNAPVGAVPRTLFPRKGYAASVGGRAADGCPTLPLREIFYFIGQVQAVILLIGTGKSDLIKFYKTGI